MEKTADRHQECMSFFVVVLLFVKFKIERAMREIERCHIFSPFLFLLSPQVAVLCDVNLLHCLLCNLSCVTTPLFVFGHTPPQKNFQIFDDF